MKRHWLTISLIASTAFLPLAQAENNCRLQLAGDSTMQITSPERHPDFGWGMALADAAKPGTKVFNFAKGGRSTRTFIEEQRWEELINNTRDGDWVLIQFGHNDASYSKRERYTAPVDFEANLRRMVQDVREVGARPILLTPVVRRHFDDEGKLRDMHGIYPSLVRDVALDMKVHLIDLFELSSEAIVELGVLNSIDLFVHIGPGVHPCCAEGRLDNTHFTRKGSQWASQIVIKAMADNGLTELAQCFKEIQ